MKKNFLFLRSLLFAVPLILTACNSSTNKNNNEYHSNVELNLKYENSAFPLLSYIQNEPNKTVGLISVPNYSLDNSFVFNFLASRVIALNIFEKNNNEVNYTTATGTIIAKASNNIKDHNYYVATNLHVASHLLDNKFEMGFNVNPYNGLIPTTDQLFDQQAIQFNPVKQEKENDKIIENYIKFVKPSSKSIVWTATNFKVKNFRVFSSEKQSNISPTITNKITNVFGKSKNFGADLAILKLDFSNFVNTKNLSSMGQKWVNFKKLFASVTEKDVEFSNNSSLDGYVLGFPNTINPLNKNSTTVGMLNLKINQPKALNKFNYFIDPFVANYKPFADQSAFLLNYNKDSYLTSINAQYVIPELNLQPGSSGSIFVQADLKIKKVYLNAIYWGVSTLDLKSLGVKGPAIPQSFGQMFQFGKNNHYDLIKNNLNDNGSFCFYLKSQNALNMRIPSFCL